MDQSLQGQGNHVISNIEIADSTIEIRKDRRIHRYQPSLGIALWSQFATPGGFHRYEPVKLFQELLPGNAVLSTF